MIPETQREALAVLAELCELSDDIRFGQLVAWLGELSQDQISRGLWDVEDDELLAVMYRHREELIARLPEAQQQAHRLRPSSISIAEGSVVPEASPSAEIGR